MKQEIIDYLIELGFVQDGEKLTKHFERKVGEAVINGQHKVQVEKLEFCIEYIGEGFEGDSEENNHPLTQWRLIINGEEHGEFLVHDAEEFKSIFVK